MSGRLVSVVMTAFQEEAFIAEALRSVLEQSHRPLEVIVVDDGSGDRTAEIAAEHGVRVVRRAHGGPAAARNTGLAVARGEYWTIFDADDVMAPGRLAAQVAYLEEHLEVGMVLGLTEAFVSPGEPRPSHFNPVWADGPYWGHPGTMLARREVLDAVGGFDETLPLCEDVDWLTRAQDAGLRVGRLDQVVLRYRIHAANSSAAVPLNERILLKVLRDAVHRRRLPSVGAALPVYNGERYLAAALTSVLMQSYPVGDIVVVDDGSEDASVAVALEFGPPVRVVSQSHAGIGAARSRAVSGARGEFVVLLDADDLLTPTSVEVRMQLLRSCPEVDIVFGQVRRFATCVDGQPLALDQPRPAHVPNAMLVRRTGFERVGPFAAGLRVAEGLDWLLRAREIGLGETTVEEQVQWRRVHGANNSLTQRGSLQEFPRVIKASLDRRRERGTG